MNTIVKEGPKAKTFVEFFGGGFPGMKTPPASAISLTGVPEVFIIEVVPATSEICLAPMVNQVPLARLDVP